MKFIRGSLLTGVALAAMTISAPVLAQTELEDRIRVLEQELKLMKTQLQNQVKQAQEAADAAAAKAEQGSGDKFTMKGPTPVWESEDGSSSIQLTGRIHFDMGLFNEGEGDINKTRFGQSAADLANGTTFRRARFGVKGKIANDWKYAITFDAGDSTSVDNAGLDVANIAYVGLKPLTFTLGKHKTPNGFEQLTSSNDIGFIERSLAINTPLGLFAEKKVGFSALANGAQWHVGGGVFFGSEQDGGTTGTTAFDDEAFSLHGRAAFAPINNDETSIHLGVNGAVLVEPRQAQDLTNSTIGSDERDCRYRDRAEIRIDGTRFVDARSQSRFINEQCWFWGVEAAVTHDAFWAQGEYYNFGMDQVRNTNPIGPSVPYAADGPDVSFNSFYVSGGWFITGEHRRYDIKKAVFKAPKVKDPFSLSKGGTGAWEVLFRYSYADLNDDVRSFTPLVGGGTRFSGVRGNEQQNITVGLNWYVNNYVMFKFNYIHVDVDGFEASGPGSPAGLTDQEIDLADFDVFALRAQVKW